jgi:putative acetyltransferase
MLLIQRCSIPAEYVLARRVTRDYLDWLAMDLAFQNVAQEMAVFSVMYGLPSGAYLLAYSGDQLAGGVGLRKWGPGVCEMKRMYVYEPFQRNGVGQALCEASLNVAKEMGYGRMRLDTVARLAAAIRLYERLGFVDIAAYRHNPDPTARFMELRLSETGRPADRDPA